LARTGGRYRWRCHCKLQYLRRRVWIAWVGVLSTLDFWKNKLYKFILVNRLYLHNCVLIWTKILDCLARLHLFIAAIFRHHLMSNTSEGVASCCCSTYRKSVSKAIRPSPWDTNSLSSSLPSSSILESSSSSLIKTR
jgi:hypothetical protein